MSLWYIAWAYLWNRKITTSLTILSVALAVALISSVLSLREEVRRRFEEESQAFDLVVGPKGSPLQLVLSSVYFMDSATGWTPLEDYEKIKADTDFVKAAYPIALGDTYQGFRLVGTTRDFFDFTWLHPVTNEPTQPFVLQGGEYFDAPMEAVIGSVVARRQNLKVGDTFVSIHGSFDLGDMAEYSHEAHPYTVTGILEPSDSPFDRAIYVDLHSVWDTHSHEEDHADTEHHEDEHAEDEPAANPLDTGEIRAADEKISAVLVQLHSIGHRWQYEEWVNTNTNSMAAIPVQVVQKFFNQFLEPMKAVLLAVGYLVVVISALSILIGLYLSIIQRKRDLAIMRALGASAFEIVGAIIIEAFWVTALGIAGGWVLGQMVTYGLGQYMAREYGMVITPFGITMDEIRAFATVGIVGIVAGILPAWQAYDRDVAHDLADRN
ncbi:MAG: ABC transporter permease [Candidatus Hydrogenedentes bacterium]|nr:ABC transporter permease [Candidatus Hydrogenedentota bacterium]